MMKTLLAAAFWLVVPLALWAQTPVTPGGTLRQPLSRGAGVKVPRAALAPAELAIAQRVYQGRLPCELGAFVSLTADLQSPGYFEVNIKHLKYRMSPVQTSTGAIRLEDPRAGAVWLQLPNKSMLMNQKLGQRLADVCMSPEQAAFDKSLRQNPPPHLLEAPPALAIQ